MAITNRSGKGDHSNPVRGIGYLDTCKYCQTYGTKHKSLVSSVAQNKTERIGEGMPVIKGRE